MKNVATKHQNDLWSSNTLPYIIPLLLGGIFTYLSLKISTAGERSLLIQLSIVIPEVLIWTIASVGAFRFKNYANLIKDHKDGKALNNIANSLLLLVLYIILLTTASTIVTLLAETDYLQVAIALRNHLPIIVILASVFFLLKGSEDLNKIVANTVWTKTRLLWLVGASFVFFIIFGYVFYTAQPNLAMVDGIPRFALPAHALLVTYILPHVIVWFVGLKACINLINYASRVTGLVYKSLFKDLYRGIILTFACIFIAQFIIITGAAVTRLSFMLILIYVVLILATLGFILILKGARKLDKIEATS